MVAGKNLTQAGQAVREELWFDHYRVSLYLPSRDGGMDRITRDSLPKAFHMEVLYHGSMPDEIPDDWAEELLPPIPDPKLEKLRQVYRGLEQGDEVVVTYAPGAGTAVKLNGETIFTDPGAELIGGVVDVFLGPDPVSEDIREGLLGPAGDEDGSS